MVAPKGFQRNEQDRIITYDLTMHPVVYLVPLADLHEGAKEADHEVSDGYIRWIEERDNARTILNGDLLNCAWKESTPELYEDLITPDQAYSNLVERLEPIKDKILMITRGGHEYSIFKKVGHDYMAMLCHALRPGRVKETDHSQDIPYRPEGGMFSIKMAYKGNSKNTYRVFYGWATHGWGGARTIGAKVKKVEELAWAVDADFYILSHDHTQNIHRFQQLTPPGHAVKDKPQYIVSRRKVLINTGGFLGYSGYSRGKGLLPSDIGTPRLRLEVRFDSKLSTCRKDLHASI